MTGRSLRLSTDELRPRLSDVNSAARPFVGRAMDLRRLDEAVASEVRLVVIEGEAGIGKTRMLDEGMAGRPSGLELFRGRTDRDDSRALGPIVEALNRHVAQWNELPDRLRRHRDVVGSLFGPAPISRPNHELGPAELCDGVVSIMGHILNRRRGVLVLDDVHWGDADLFGALRRIVYSDLPCSVIVTTRNEDEAGALSELLDDVTRRVHVERLMLGPLGVDDVRRFILDAIGVAATVRAEDVHERTGGHPLLLQQLLDTGELGGEMTVSALPTTIGESVRRRVVRLDETSRSVLHAAAVLGSTNSFDELSVFLSLDESALLAALRRLSDERLLIETTPDQFTFAHALTREVVENSLLTRERRALHRRALDSVPPGAEPGAVLRHALQAGDARRTLDAAKRGAAPALANGRPALAARMASAGLEVEPDDIELTSVLARAAWQLRHRDQACHAARRTLDLADEADVQLLARSHHLLGRIAFEVVDVAAHRASVDALIELLERADAGDRPLILNSLAELTMLSSEVDAVRWAEQALLELDDAGSAEAPMMVNLGAALTDVPGRREEGRQLLRRVIDMGDDAGDSLLQARALNNLLCEGVYAYAGDELRLLLDRLEAVTFRSGLGAQMGENLALFRAVTAERAGDQTATLDALSWFGRSPPEQASCLALFAVSFDESRGAVASARRGLNEIKETTGLRFGRLQRFWMQAIETRVRLGEGADPVDLVTNLLKPEARPSRYMLDALDLAGHALTAISRMSAAAAQSSLTAWQDWAGEDPDGRSIHQHLLAIKAEHDGDFAGGRDAYMRSLGGLPRRAAVVTADAERGIARCWAALGDRTEARRWSTAAVARLSAWPGPGLDESVRLLRSLGGRPPRSGRDASLSDRELEVAVLVSQGLTNIAIGGNLHISARTVAVHVSHILDKLGATKRAEIAAYAVREQLAG